jgi:predicted anti-sigma-YlaC factor YlaD
MSNKKIPCNDVLNHICENLDEDLQSPTCRSIKSHLEECPECVVYLKRLKNTINLYRNYPSPKPSGTANRNIERFLLKIKITHRKR